MDDGEKGQVVWRVTSRQLWILGTLVVVVAIVLWGIYDSERELGNPAVHDRIKALTDCGELQQEFNTSMDWFDREVKGTARAKMRLSYAHTADERMRQIGCY